ncbi:major facilitator superfamily domain-containing protein [Aspergillus pseudonomiae]|uniref:Major facilitator superfamily domain-containing protein n=1 Tax=Aspergillus pseudonomiae TaxID=1506151 RepID=A0A5N7DTJ6_9EURO|nr:major facilitator superfamily domain-containing protein [Aspergillus pseudonomiae]KAE8409787.1 major facilitator superfamily domain-containing protein [Aspergillus pseudonomiae]
MNDSYPCSSSQKPSISTVDETSRSPEGPTEQDSVVDFPDGGWRAWSVVLGSWCAMVPSFGLLNTMGVLEAWLANDQLKEYSKASIGWIFGLYSFFLYFGSVQVGPVFDAYGLRPLLIPGCIGLVSSLMVFSVAREYYQFMLGFSVLGGISSSMVFTPSIACIAHWFHRRRALATGIAATAGGFGGIIFPILIWNLSEVVGFAWAIRITGFVCTLFCILCILFLKTRLPPKKLGGGKIDIRVLREIPFSLLTVAIFLIDFALLIPLTYLTSYAESHDMEESLAYQLVSILNAASILGRVVPGYFADHYGRFNVMIVTTLVCTVFTLALWLPAGSNTAAVVAYAVLFGFWSGSAISLAPVCVAQISSTEDFGKRYGTTYSLVSVGALFAIPIAGEIMKAQSSGREKDNYSGLILFCGLVYACACLFFALARGVSIGWRLKTMF